MQAPADQHHRCSDTADEQHLQRFGRALSIAGEVGAEGLQRVVGHHRIGRQEKANDLKGVGVHKLRLGVSLLKHSCAAVVSSLHRRRRRVQGDAGDLGGLAQR